MRKHFAAALAVVAALVGLVVAADLSGAGSASSATLQATPATSEEPATVTVGPGDAASRCEQPAHEGSASPETVATSVTLELTSDNGTMQTDMVTPDATGDFGFTYMNLGVGTYTVNGTCNYLNGAAGAGAEPLAPAPFTYQPATFVVTAPTTPTAPAATAGVVAARPAFTG